MRKIPRAMNAINFGNQKTSLDNGRTQHLSLISLLQCRVTPVVLCRCSRQMKVDSMNIQPRNIGQILVRTAALALALASGSPAHTQQPAFPLKPVRIIVPAAPGGPADTVARLVGQKLSEEWGQPVIVENRPGAAGSIGANAVAKAPPDGYTLLITNSAPLVVNAALMGSLPYDPVKDLAPISRLCWSPNVMVVPAASSADSVKSFVAMAKANPGKFNVGTPGNGTLPHMAAAMLNNRAGIDLVVVPYRGGPQATNALLSSETSVYFEAVGVALAQAKAGRLKMLGVTSAERFRAMPDVPTMQEAGVPDFDMKAWYGLVAPGGTHKALIDQINVTAQKMLNDPQFKSQLAAAGFEAQGNTPEVFVADIAAETLRMARLIKTAGIKPE